MEMLTHEFRLLFLRKPGDRINICGIVGCSSRAGWRGSVIELFGHLLQALASGEQVFFIQKAGMSDQGIPAFGVSRHGFYRMMIS